MEFEDRQGNQLQLTFVHVRANPGAHCEGVSDRIPKGVLFGPWPLRHPDIYPAEYTDISLDVDDTESPGRMHIARYFHVRKGICAMAMHEHFGICSWAHARNASE